MCSVGAIHRFKISSITSVIDFANLLKRLGDHENAENFYKKAIEINPNYLPSYNNVMDLYDKSNQNENFLTSHIVSESVIHVYDTCAWTPNHAF